jgi:hypothetical protein
MLVYFSSASLKKVFIESMDRLSISPILGKQQNLAFPSLNKNSYNFDPKRMSLFSPYRFSFNVFKNFLPSLLMLQKAKLDCL